MNEQLIIDNETLYQDFLNHLNLKDNNDIIFSAPFGTGKTYFLKEDFSEKAKDEYNTIHLYPVNYSISSNDDIFELIKYDILFDLLLSKKDHIQDLGSLEIDKGLAIQLYIQNNFKVIDFVQQIFKTTSKLGKSLSDILELLKSEKNKLESFYHDLKTNEYDIITKYLESFEFGKGAKEYDTISALISEILVRIKEDNKQNILVIDDLDRIDPEHIFRIFNVLSAHRDYHTNKNKFGFDKVILVCDIENIRRIYEHRYGKNVDFQGYINKFYSKSVYSFDNTRYVKEVLRDYLDNLEYSDFKEEYKRFKLNSGYDYNFYLIISTFLQIFISNKKLSLRSLKNISDLKVPNRTIYNQKRLGYHRQLYNHDFLMLIEYLSVFFGNRRNLKVALDELVYQNFEGDLISLGIDKYDHSMLITELVRMVIQVDQMYHEEEGENCSFKIWDTDIVISYVKKSRFSGSIIYFDKISEDKLYQIDILKLFNKALTIVDGRNLL